MNQKLNYFLTRISAKLKINFEKLTKAILLINLCHTHLIHNSEHTQGLVTVPVADLIGDSIHSNHSNIFFKLPLAGVGIHDCPRLHQALFHEIITIIEKQGKLIKIKIPNMFYELPNGEKQNQYWTLSKNITPLEEITEKDKKSLPDPISYKKTDNFKHSNNTIATLIHPWRNPKTSFTYSAGTRFKIIDNSQHTFDNLITILLFNTNTKKIEPADIPKKYLFITSNHTINQKIRYFIKLLKTWIKQSTIIPYVWGGSSYTKRYKEKSFHITQKKNATYYDRAKIKDNPKTGFDCSGLIARAAQIVGIPFYYKNTSTMAHNLKELSKNDPIENGDIIWIPGHVMIVSDINQNLLIEAGAYSYGYGFLHEIPLEQQFKNIKTYSDLRNVIEKKLPITRLGDHVTKKEKRYYDIKILKLKSTWS